LAAQNSLTPTISWDVNPTGIGSIVFGSTETKKGSVTLDISAGSLWTTKGSGVYYGDTELTSTSSGNNLDSGFANIMIPMNSYSQFSTLAE
jgi:hypothetical protein